MSEASAWRFELGRRIGMAYAADPKARVVMIAGSTGRGTADRYSDLEIDVYWSAPPTDDERRAAVARSGGTLLEMWPYEENEWSEEIDVGGFHVGTSTFLVETMEAYLDDVLERHSTERNPQIQIASLLRSRALVGEDLVARWRARAEAYPDGLVHAMLRDNLRFEGFGYAEEMLAARDDQLALYALFVQVERQILGALLGLNRLYLPNPRFKGMDELIGDMRLAPPRLSARLKHAFHLSPVAGVALLHEVIEEVFGLVEMHVPAFDTGPFRERVRRRRPVFDKAPT